MGATTADYKQSASIGGKADTKSAIRGTESSIINHHPVKTPNQIVVQISTIVIVKLDTQKVHRTMKYKMRYDIEERINYVT